MSKKYKMNMENEREPKRLFSEGDHNFEIMCITEEVSKAGNEMLVINFQEIETGYTDIMYFVVTEGKRWMLKRFLMACGVEPDKDTTNNYVWDQNDVLGKVVIGVIAHEPNTYINRNGDTVNTTQSRIVEFKEYSKEEVNMDDEEETVT